MIESLEPWAQDALRAGTGLAIGALVGLERGFKLRDQREGHRVAGVRTFTLIGLAAGISGLLSPTQPLVAAVIVAAMLGYLAIAYAPRLKAKGDATSPIAAAATIAAAFLGGAGWIGIALAAGAIIVLLDQAPECAKPAAHNSPDQRDSILQARRIRIVRAGET